LAYWLCRENKVTRIAGAALVLLAATFAAMPVQAQPSCGEARWCAFHNNADKSCWCWRHSGH